MIIIQGKCLFDFGNENLFPTLYLLLLFPPAFSSFSHLRPYPAHRRNFYPGATAWCEFALFSFSIFGLPCVPSFCRHLLYRACIQIHKTARLGQNKEKERKLVDKSIKMCFESNSVPLRNSEWDGYFWLTTSHLTLCINVYAALHILHSLKFAIEQFHYNDLIVLLHFSANIEEMRGMPSQNLLNFVMVTETLVLELYLVVLQYSRKTKLYKTRWNANYITWWRKRKRSWKGQRMLFILICSEYMRNSDSIETACRKNALLLDAKWKSIWGIHYVRGHWAKKKNTVRIWRVNGESIEIVLEYSYASMHFIEASTVY